MAIEQPGRAEGIGLPPGAKIGKYEVRERTAIGGQAIVYKCFDPFLERFVAVKQISARLAEDPKFLDRFRREAQILAKLGAEQPAIITIHDLVEDERGLFIVTEFVEGHTLETLLREGSGPIETKAALQILWRLASALHDVHRAGIIHRDIKPSNIIICEGLRPKITDFGVAASVTGQTSMLLGTTKYMAPELFSGGPADGRADMYSLGFVAYEMLVGREKFNEIFSEIVRDPHSEALRWMKWHGNPQVEAPPVHKVAPSVPRELSGIVAKMIAKDPDQRFESMEALGVAMRGTFSPKGRRERAGRAAEAELAFRGRGSAMVSRTAAAVAGRGEGDRAEAVAPEAPATAPIPKSTLSRRTKLVLLGVILVSAVAMGVMHLVRSSREERARARALAGAYNGALQYYGEDDFSAALAGFEQVTKRYAGTVEGKKSSVLAHMCRAHLAVAGGKWQEAADEEKLADQRLRWVQETTDGMRDWIDRTDKEIEDFKGYRISTRIFRDAMRDARAAFARKDYQAARDLLRQKLRGEQVALTPAQSKERAAFLLAMELAEFEGEYQAYLQRGDALTKEGKYAEAKEAYQAADVLLRSRRARDILDARQRGEREVALREKLTVLGGERVYAEARRKAEEAAAKQDRPAELAALEEMDAMRPSPETKDRIKTLHAEIACQEGLAHKQAGKYDDAAAAFKKALSFKEVPEARKELEALERRSQRLGLIAAGDAAKGTGNWQEALDKYGEAAAIQPDEELLSKMADCRFEIGVAAADALRTAGRYDQALDAYEKLRTIKADAGTTIDAKILATRQDKAYTERRDAGDRAVRIGEYAKARKLYADARAIRDTVEIQERMNEVFYQENLAKGDGEMDQGNYASALGYYRIAASKKDTEEIKARIVRAKKALGEDTE